MVKIPTTHICERLSRTLFTIKLLLQYECGRKKGKHGHKHKENTLNKEREKERGGGAKNQMYKP
jgi:hypothetical protein